MKNIIFFIIFILFVFPLGAQCSDHDLYLEGFFETFIGHEIMSDFQGILKINSFHTDFEVGRKKFDWGAGKTDSLIFSSAAPPISIVSYTLEIPEIKYSHFIGSLERSNNRWLFGHRLDFDLQKYTGSKIGVWELMVSSDQVFSGYYLPIPLVPLYAVQHISYKCSDRIYDYNSNAMFGFDFEQKIGNSEKIYGEVLVDDFPQKAEYGNPRKAAGLLGFEIENLDDNIISWVEYVRINNFVYTHKNPNNRFLYHGRPFGHWLGMDGDLFALGIEQKLNENYAIKYQFRFIRKGEGDYTDNWEREYGDTKEFLTGTIEYSSEFYVGFIHNLSKNLNYNVSILAGEKKNSEHIEGFNSSYLKLQFSCSYEYSIKIFDF